MPTKRIPVHLSDEDQALLIEVQALVQKREQKLVSASDIFKRALQALKLQELDN